MGSAAKIYAGLAFVLVLFALWVAWWYGGVYDSYGVYWAFFIYAAACALFYFQVLRPLLDGLSSGVWGWVVTGLMLAALLGFGKVATMAKYGLNQRDVGTSAAVVRGTVSVVKQHHSIVWASWYDRWSWEITYNYQVGYRVYTQCDDLHTRPVLKAPLAAGSRIKVIYSLSRPGIARIYSMKSKAVPNKNTRPAGNC